MTIKTSSTDRPQPGAVPAAHICSYMHTGHETAPTVKALPQFVETPVLSRLPARINM